MCGTLGTTSICSFDDLEEIGPICKDNDLKIEVPWLGFLEKFLE